MKTLTRKDQIRSDQSLSRVRFYATPWIAARQASLSITNSRSSPRPMSIESVMPSSHLILCHPLLLLPPIPPSWCWDSDESFPMSQVFPWGGQSTGVSALASFLPKKSQGWSSEWTGLDLLAVQRTLKNLHQHHSSKASILRRSAFFTVQLSHPSMTTGKTIALTRWTFVGKVMYLLFNMLSRLVIAFLPRSKRLLISWFQSFSVQYSSVQSLSHVRLFHFMVNRWRSSETVADFIFGDSKITVDGVCSHEIKRRLLLGRKAITNLDSILKGRDITLPTKSV